MGVIKIQNDAPVFRVHFTHLKVDSADIDPVVTLPGNQILLDDDVPSNASNVKAIGAS